ncbi:putative MFS multidrug transporter [Lasiosphaeria hispida]|uniref:MFS multidrug transporter n=1 Tax=Lasiosphaeria hispida TaxID=260671 RepID=A0AAJ0HPP3_9PEZI|nr:putative MFS multidrug transporter [Lasiosphaeria hispida]
MFGKLYTFFSVKASFLVSVFLFEAGSAICGAAPNSVSLIVGRAIAGLGSAGIISGVWVILVYAVPLHKRPLFQGIFGAIFGISAIIGPVIGGAFTSNVSWRWCFYINLPLGGVAMACTAVLLKVPDRDTTRLPLKDKILQLDLLGTAALLPGIVCLLLSLQWGGSTYAWNNPRIIALLTLAAVLLIAFCLIQVYKPSTATVPPRIFCQRSVLSAFWATICIGAHMMLFVYFLPVYFQAIKSVSAIDSGIRLLPMCLPFVLSSLATGVATSRVGYYSPFILAGVVLMSAGAGLLTTLQVDTGPGRWIGYQVLYGWGMGMAFQAPNLAAQTVLASRDVPIGTTLISFSQLLGGAVFISVGQNVLNGQLLERLSGVDGFDTGLLAENGATTLIEQLPEAVRGVVLVAYNEALRKVFQVGLVMTVLTIIGAGGLEWRSVRKNVVREDVEGKRGEQTIEGEIEEKVVSKVEEQEKGKESDDDGKTVVVSNQERVHLDNKAA